MYILDKFKEYLNGYLTEERPGFSGLNHVLIAAGLFLLLLLIPIPYVSSFLSSIVYSSPIVAILAFLLVCGGALLPDCDNLKSDGGSAATWSLGFIGSILSSSMVTVSSVMTSIFHGKKDVDPFTQHRFFWHTLLVPIVFFLLIYFLVPGSDTAVIDGIKGGSLSAIIILFAAAISVYVGASMLLGKLFKILPIKIKASTVSFLISLAMVLLLLFISTQTQLKLYAYCICLGYLFHLLGDMFADGGIPALFPITGIFGKFWMRIHLLPRALTVTTGSVIESILKIVFLCIDLVLLALVTGVYAYFI